MRDRLPLILSSAALVVAVLGTPLGEAAFNAIAPNSVGADHLRNGAVTNAKLRGDAVTSGKVKNRSLKAIDFAEGQLPAGPPGPKGDKGDKGPPGDPATVGCPSGTTRVVSVCVEPTLRPTKDWSVAAEDCAATQKRLPSAGELHVYRRLPGVTLASGGEWVDFFALGSSGFAYATVQQQSFGFQFGANNPRPYRCVGGLVGST